MDVTEKKGMEKTFLRIHNSIMKNVFVRMNTIVFICFFRSLRLVLSLDARLWDPLVIEEWRNKRESYSVDASKAILKRIEDVFDESKKNIMRCKGLLPMNNIPFKTMVALMFGLRFSLIAIAAFNPVNCTVCFLLSFLQFYFAPFSFSIALLSWLMFFPNIILPGMASVIVLHSCVWLLLGSNHIFCLEMTWYGIITFLFIDQVVCFLVYFRCPTSVPKRFPFREFIVHIIYGFVNTKTYWLLLLACMVGRKIDFAVWFLDLFVFQLSRRFAELLKAPTETKNVEQNKTSVTGKMPNWMVMFYCLHRTAHLPVVYDQAHRFHHFLHDSTAFDAHIYGSGMPEEWALLFFDIFLFRFTGILPYSLTYLVLSTSLDNKLGHMRTIDPSEEDVEQTKTINDINADLDAGKYKLKYGGLGGVNFHTDHHTYHRANYGIYGPVLDMICGTCAPNNDFREDKIYVMVRDLGTEENQNVTLKAHYVPKSTCVVGDDLVPFRSISNSLGKNLFIALVNPPRKEE